MAEGVDWKKLNDAIGHMFAKHKVTPEQATEAVNDLDAVWFDPDPKSKTGISVRVIGYSHTARAILTVILLHDEPGPGWIGINGWRSNSTDSRSYREGA